VKKMRLLNSTQEAVLKLFLDSYVPNETGDLSLEIDYEKKPKWLQFTEIARIKDSLETEGVYLQTFTKTLGSSDLVYLTPIAFSYFNDKETYYMEQENKVLQNNSTNNFYGDSKNVQIQQNTQNSTQTMSISELVDFDKALEVFDNVLGNLDSFNLSDNDKEHLKSVAKDGKSLAESKTDASRIKKSLFVIKDIMLRATGSLTAQGILFGLQQFIGG